MRKETRRSSNIKDLLKRKGGALKSNSSVSIVDQINKVTETSLKIETKKKKSPLKEKNKIEGAIVEKEHSFFISTEPAKDESRPVKDNLRVEKKQENKVDPVAVKGNSEINVQALTSPTLDVEVEKKKSFKDSSAFKHSAEPDLSVKKISSSDLLNRYRKVLRIVKPGLAMQYFVLCECSSDAVLSISRREIADILNVTENSVRVVLKSLRTSGLLKIEAEPSGGAPASYRFLF